MHQNGRTPQVVKTIVVYSESGGIKEGKEGGTSSFEKGRKKSPGGDSDGKGKDGIRVREHGKGENMGAIRLNSRRMRFV